ncbi:MAG: hypothetical protein J6T80_00180 [Paludibacteraceae bacterium]|nr:hypothetical protein [Paludibacteraceae bacterium]
MKNFIWLLFFGIMLCSCEKQPATNEPVGGNGGSGGDDEPEMRMSLVKFTNDIYREYILATAFSDNARMRATSPPVAEELILGTIPYSVKLPNGYWVIDWRWESGQIVYYWGNVLLPYKWDTFTHWYQTWELPDNPMPFEQYIAESGGVGRRDIDKILGVNLDIQNKTDHRWQQLYCLPRVYALHYVSMQDVPEEEKESYLNTIHEQDSLHTLYVQRLTEIINNGDFDKVYHKTSWYSPYSCHEK